MLRVTEAQYLSDHRIRLEFSDGAVGVVDLEQHLDGPIFRPLKDTQYLAAFELTDHTLQWPNGADFAPEYLRDLICEVDTSNHSVPPSRGGQAF